MPRSLAGHTDLFRRHGLHDNVSLLGVDYGHRTANVYFGNLPDGFLDPQNLRAMLGELGLPEPSEQLLKLAQEAFGIYVTLSWDSPKVERFCFSILTPDPMTLPARPDPKIEEFLRNVPYDAAGGKVFYAAISPTEGEFHKIQTYYQWRDRTLNLMQLADSAEEHA